MTPFKNNWEPLNWKNNVPEIGPINFYYIIQARREKDRQNSKNGRKVPYRIGGRGRPQKLKRLLGEPQEDRNRKRKVKKLAKERLQEFNSRRSREAKGRDNIKKCTNEETEFQDKEKVQMEGVSLGLENELKPKTDPTEKTDIEAINDNNILKSPTHSKLNLFCWMGNLENWKMKPSMLVNLRLNRRQFSPTL
ncbi:hypothetical protein TWF481_002896 [Arthrobotrys musiformis]|uniref:Uncharacterized protein n=1 Tax=Arthrobotrys musiformis TaxID=47236 RepID=A0AAV9VTH9_9PEZI